MPPKILSDSDKVGTMTLYLDGKEIGPCAELAEDLPEINLETEDQPERRPILPHEFEITLVPAHRPRWRMIKRAYKLIRMHPFMRVCENEMRKALENDGFVTMEVSTDIGKSCKIIKMAKQSELPAGEFVKATIAFE